jgi:hypothetical protein
MGAAFYRDYIAIGVIYDSDKMPIYNDVDLIVLTPDVTLAGDRRHKQSTRLPASQLPAYCQSLDLILTFRGLVFGRFYHPVDLNA